MSLSSARNYALRAERSRDAKEAADLLAKAILELAASIEATDAKVKKINKSGSWSDLPQVAAYGRANDVGRRRRRAGDLPVRLFCSQRVNLCLKKYSAFPKSQITLYQPRPAPKEGRWPSSRTLEQDAVDAAASGTMKSQGGLCLWAILKRARRATLMRTAKSCGPDASVPASSLAEALTPNRAGCAIFRKATVTRKPIAGEITK
jgi:hypothetical protein